ncbi:MAG: CBS domain-containing protein [Betaproteobacteria bacterium]|nr:MAG: CBS domain-containing protein [Betaproteobacteria bacterium]
MRKLLYQSGTGTVLAFLSTAVPAAQLEDVQTLISRGPMYALVLFAIIAAVWVYSMRLRDKRAAPLKRLLQEGEAIHSVGPDTLVTACVRTMTAEKIGALMVMDGETLIGIFTERDALNKVLAAGLDPRSTKVSEVMTRDPYCVPPTTSVGAAMGLVTQRRFRHLPIVENGKLLAVISSGDLTHWLVKDKIGEVRELVDLAAR